MFATCTKGVTALVPQMILWCNLITQVLPQSYSTGLWRQKPSTHVPQSSLSGSNTQLQEETTCALMPCLKRARSCWKKGYYLPIFTLLLLLLLHVAQQLALRIFLYCSPCDLETGSFTEYEACCFGYTGWPASEPGGSVCLATDTALGLQESDDVTPSFGLSPETLHSHPHVCTARILLTDPSLHPLFT